MSKDSIMVSTILKELSALRSEQEKNKNELMFIQSITRDDWYNAIVGERDGRYKPYESDALVAKKNAYLDKSAESKKHIEERPEEKKRIDEIRVLERVPRIFLTIMLCAAALFLFLGVYSCIMAPEYFYFSLTVFFLPGVIMLIVVAVYSVKIKLADRIRQRRDVRQRNLEIEKYNREIYPSLCLRHEEILNSDREECERLRKQLYSEIDKCISDIRTKEYEFRWEAGRLSERIADEKFSVFSIRDYSSEQLDTMARYLDEGRADNYKEALNLYISESTERAYREKLTKAEKERQAAHEKELYKMRRAEMEARTAVRDAEKRGAEMQKQFEKLQKQSDDRCRPCKKYYSCGKKNCTGFVPK